ncbi:unnamed protein product, partial [Ostreobium quekettii]
HGCTALSGASMKGHDVVVELLLSRGATVDSIDKDGDTPLSNAISYGHPSTVDLLLKHGARTDIPNETGATPLFHIWSEQRKQKIGEQTASAIFRTMLDHGAAVEVADK